jgi:hypothetical protein
MFKLLLCMLAVSFGTPVLVAVILHLVRYLLSA